MEVFEGFQSRILVKWVTGSELVSTSDFEAMSIDFLDFLENSFWVV